MACQMVFKDFQTIRHSIMMIAIYHPLIYLLLVIVFYCAQIIVQGMEIEPDWIMPETVEDLTDASRTPWLAWRIVIAPFAAVISSFGSFLLMVFPLSFGTSIDETSIQTQANGKSSG